MVGEKRATEKGGTKPRELNRNKNNYSILVNTNLYSNFREPGGVLLGVMAANPPGFTIDEKPQELGTHLMLPKWLEPVRKDIGENKQILLSEGLHNTLFVLKARGRKVI